MLEKHLQKSCLNRLSVWQMEKVVVYYTDLSQYGVRQIRGRYVKRTDKGLPDIVAYVKHKDLCCVCWFELKTDIGKMSQHQLQFLIKFKDLTNVHYYLIRNPDELDNSIESLTNHYTNKLKEIC